MQKKNKTDKEDIDMFTEVNENSIVEKKNSFIRRVGKLSALFCEYI